ncbi:MAG: hypothetical protein A3C93_00050 [Candidatus Lloydbacteria bacterium RIFCSPHIGHO2_02_FULL_54_17]|uniref:HIT domain-containing protein n=1 Tax=Candidatus Lloydbacteria bacterium RIFCSPHIGHO2_02_FULL_54_17 TaxID=1798664 RepID=A0A1G2DI21_9BACT|nr:MAG: hypothetical protein A3C93_00050 [Candidatus Lloydbacteria bacterium RIFCSPHIGHO2_02_FULL_54_17]OGZ17102.1 MAG: hypothetical protein A3H76_02845 [Candidatus Lloydbacteria bacterium RIFCSPLOWO2_02_FULL_54_12]
MDDCLFCKIAERDIPCEKVYEDQDVLAFLDIHPINPGHTLVIPKKHAADISALTRADFERLMGCVHALAPIVKKAVQADGINIGMNNGGAAGQLVFHAHLHIIPRYQNDGFRHWHGNPYGNGEIRAVAEKIRSAVAN